MHGWRPARVDYDRQGEVIQQTDQNGTVHAYSYDGLGRRTADAVTALPEGLDTAVLRIETTFDVRGLVTQVTSYDAATSGMVVNQVQRKYNGFQQLTREYQEHGGPVDGSSLYVDYSYADGSANTIRRAGCVYPNGRNVSYLYHSPGDDQLSRVSAIADGTLLQGLISYWPLNESVSSGDRDDEQDGNTLVDTNNNVSHDTGNPSGNLGVAAAFDGTSAQLRLYPLGNLSFNRQSFTTTGWIYFNDVSASIGMWGAGIAHSSNIYDQAWTLVLSSEHGKITFLLSDGYPNQNFNESTFSPSVNTWYFVAAWYDAEAGKSYIQINDGTPHEFAGVGPTDRNFEFVIGRSYGYWLDGRAQAVGVWDRVLTDDERAALYNGNDGLQYPFGVQPLAEYTYLGLVTPVIVDYPQPQVKYNLAISDGMGDKYTGLDRFGRVFNNLWQDYNSTPVSAVELHYGYDRASNRLWRQDIVAGSANFDELYKYDGLYRLTDMKRGRLNGTQTDLNSGSENFEQQWNLDKTGNWTGFQEDSTGGGSWTLDQSRAANPVNEITDITNTTGSAWSQPGYDAAGNMTTIPQPADMSGQFTATYDAWNRLVKLVDPATSHTVQENWYDGSTRRTIQKTYTAGSLTETRHYFYSDAWQVLEEQVVGATYTPDRQFVWGLRYIDDLILRDRSFASTLDERLYALQDANWNVTTLVDASGAIKQRFTYTAYGLPVYLNSIFGPGSYDFQWETLYCGYRWDGRNDGSYGLYLQRMRPLHSILGCWTTKDFIKSNYDPSSYQYVRSSPLSFVDPWGLYLVAVDGTGSGSFLDFEHPNNQKKSPNKRLLSHIWNFYEDYKGAKNYYPGPGTLGQESQEIITKAYADLREYQKRGNTEACEQIDMVGHSRGGYIVSEVARMMERDKMQFKNANNKVRFMGLYDPVIMQAGIGVRAGTNQERISGNVETVEAIISKPMAFGLNGYSPTSRSRGNWNRMDQGPEDKNLTSYTSSYIWGTHSALGGAPGFAGTDDIIGQVFYSKADEIHAAIWSDLKIRSKAKIVGVPITETLDVQGYLFAPFPMSVPSK